MSSADTSDTLDSKSTATSGRISCIRESGEDEAAVTSPSLHQRPPPTTVYPSSIDPHWARTELDRISSVEGKNESDDDDDDVDEDEEAIWGAPKSYISEPTSLDGYAF
jgi:hypothetical protein